MSTKKITESIQGEVVKSTAARKAQVDPAKEIKVKKAAETKAKAQSIIESGILNSEIVENYNCLLTTMKDTEARIKELFSIEAEGLSFADVINAKTAYIAEVKATADSKIAEAEAIYDQAVANVEKLNAENEARITARNAEIIAERAKAKEEYDYNLIREHKKDDDTWADVKAAREKILADKETAVDAREEAVTAIEADYAKVKKQVEDMPQTIAIAVNKAVVSAVKDAESKFEIEKTYIEKDHTSQLALKEAKILMIEEQLANSCIANVKLQEKLEEAYAKIQEISLATVQGVKANEVMEAVKKMSNNNSSSK